ncbi:MAG TPA: cell division protein ZipA C-terminal FtsZ-binding domain-containing protein [Steroidobacteraceae bacterium]|nr:cell division protein ZipA C-terminal FtsZ-binding domain-containing protein [Steroidobacteraceae bacterium]
MSELRVALIVLGAVFLAVLLLWERRRASRQARPAPPPELSATSPAPVPPRTRRMEPSIEDFSPGEAELPGSLDVPTIHPVEPVRVEVMREVAVDVPAAAAAARIDAPAARAEPAPGDMAFPATPVIRWPPPRTERVLTVRLVRADGQALAGRALRLALEAAGMVHGPQRIYHRVDVEGVVRASAANLVRPGSLDPSQMDAQEFRGLSLFAILPGPVPAMQMLDDLLQLARTVAGRVGAVVQDEQGALLEGERLARLKGSLAPPTGGPPA